MTETDPSHDVGWLGCDSEGLRARKCVDEHSAETGEVSREGIRNLQPRTCRPRARRASLSNSSRERNLPTDGNVDATVRPEQIAPTIHWERQGNVTGVHFELDMMPGLTITSHRPNLQSTAYGLLADFINAVK